VLIFRIDTSDVIVRQPVEIVLGEEHGHVAHGVVHQGRHLGERGLAPGIHDLPQIRVGIRLESAALLGELSVSNFLVGRRRQAGGQQTCDE
jgi:hypothetical protein